MEGFVAISSMWYRHVQWQGVLVFTLMPYSAYVYALKRQARSIRQTELAILSLLPQAVSSLEGQTLAFS